MQIGNKNKLQHTHVSQFYVHDAHISSICAVRHKIVHDGIVEVCQAYSSRTTLNQTILLDPAPCLDRKALYKIGICSTKGISYAASMPHVHLTV